jgi:hypothetical protein
MSVMSIRRFTAFELVPGFAALLFSTSCLYNESTAPTDAAETELPPDASTPPANSDGSAPEADAVEVSIADASSEGGPPCTSGWCAATVGVAEYANSGINGFTADATYAYWTQTNEQGAGLFWLPLTGGTVRGLDNGSFEAAGVVNANASGVFFFLNNFDDPKPGSNYTSSQVNAGKSTYATVGSMGAKVTAGAIAGDGTSVYWIDAANVSLMKGTPGGGTVTTLVAGLGTTTGELALEGGNVYWADTTSIRMVSSAGQGGAATTFQSGQVAPGFVAADANNVYWTTQGSLVRVPIGGGALVTITSGQTFSYVAIDATSFYWSTGTQIEEVPLLGVGVTPTVLYALATGAGEADEHPYGLAVVGSCLYWIGGVSQSVLRSLTPRAMTGGETI